MDSPPVSMRLSDVCFVHWPVAPEALARAVPAGVTLDTVDGRAWLSVVGMRVRPRFVSTGQSYAQVTVRTYVAGDPPGVYFLDAVADDILAVGGGRVLFDVPMRYGSVDVERTVEGCEVRCDRLGRRVFEMAVTPAGAPTPPKEGTLAHWLVERYRYVDDSVHEIEHPPWRLQRATGGVRSDRLLSDLPDPVGDPVFQYSPGALVET